MTARAKWDAWAQMAKDYEGRADGAETRYLEIARGLGWKEGAPLLSSEPSTGDDADGRGGGTGMGVSVSVLSAPALEADEAGTLHGLVVENDLDALSALIEANPTIDLNAKDEYVCLVSLRCAPLAESIFRNAGIHPTSSRLRQRQRRDSPFTTTARRGPKHTGLPAHYRSHRRILTFVTQDPDEFTAKELANVAGHDEIAALLS